MDGFHFKGNEVVGLSLEVTHSSIGGHYLDEIRKGYDIIMNLGISPGINSVLLERIAVNWQDDRKDEEGISSGSGRIVKDGPDGLFTRLPVEAITHSLRSVKIPCDISFSAGTFLGNKIFYYSLYYTKSRAGLIHFPLETESSLEGEYPTMNIEHMIKSVELAIQKTI